MNLPRQRGALTAEGGLYGARKIIMGQIGGQVPAHGSLAGHAEAYVSQH
jgi:hypothetical protein